MSFEIRKLMGSDKPSMRSLVQAVLDEQGLQPQFYWPLEMLNAEILSCEAVGICVGPVLAGFVLYRKLPQAWEVSLVASHPQFRRKGHIQALLSHLVAAKAQGVELWLEVHEENLAAQNLYEKLGFRETGRRPKYYKDLGTAILYTYSG